MTSAAPVTTPVLRSANVHEAVKAFLSELSDWAQACMREYAGNLVIDNHDQATYTTSWAPLIQRGDSRLLVFMKKLRDGISACYSAQGRWRHGYWGWQEVHHGTEHFELFLGTLWKLDPRDAGTATQFLDAAEHLGNWVPEVPAWFDWDTGLFRALHFGTERVGDGPGESLNVPDHFRCVNLALLAHAVSGEARYLELARAHGWRWAMAICDGEALPAGLQPEGPVYTLSSEADTQYHAFAGMAGALDDDLDRAENLLASNAISALLALWTLTGEEPFRLAAERLLCVLTTQLNDPDAGAAVDALRCYRMATGDTRFDTAILDAADALVPEPITELALEPFVSRSSRPRGIGKRTDMPAWFEDGVPRRHSPVLLAAAAELRNDASLATRALDLGRAYFGLARQAYPHGREHGCSARTVNAIARGHGRENGAGVVTAVLVPLMERFITT